MKSRESLRLFAILNVFCCLVLLETGSFTCNLGWPSTYYVPEAGLHHEAILPLWPNARIPATIPGSFTGSLQAKLLN